MANVGYSGTPLPKKLGIKEDYVVAIRNAPDNFSELLGELPSGTELRPSLRGNPEIIVAFYTDTKQFRSDLPKLAKKTFPGGAIWFAWPKKTAKPPHRITSDLDENTIRATALANKLVDVKVCAISETWSGLKVVWRKEHR